MRLDHMCDDMVTPRSYSSSDTLEHHTNMGYASKTTSVITTYKITAVNNATRQLSLFMFVFRELYELIPDLSKKNGKIPIIVTIHSFISFADISIKSLLQPQI